MGMIPVSEWSRRKSDTARSAPKPPLAVLVELGAEAKQSLDSLE